MTAQPQMETETTARLVVAWRQGAGFMFGTVKTSEQFQGRLREITAKMDARLGGMQPVTYAIGDDIETDEFMLCPLAAAAGRQEEAQPEIDAAEITAPEIERVRRQTKRSASPKEPVEFRNRLVTTVSDELPIGAAFLRELRKPIVFYAIIRGDDVSTRLAYVRHLNPVRLINPGSVIAMLGDTLDEILAPIFAMDERIDMVIRPDNVVIIDKNFFESVFFDLSGHGTEIDTVVKQTLSVLPFSPATLEMLVERSRGRKRMRRKMLEIREANHLENVTLDDFKAALKAQGFEESKFLLSGAIIASEEDGELLLQILNEDLFKGALTGRPFSVTRKARRSST